MGGVNDSIAPHLIIPERSYTSVSGGIKLSSCSALCCRLKYPRAEEFMANDILLVQYPCIVDGYIFKWLGYHLAIWGSIVYIRKTYNWQSFERSHFFSPHLKKVLHLMKIHQP